MENGFCVPPALLPYASLPRWVVWRLETVKGRPTKVPYQPNDPLKKAKSTVSSTWGDADTAIEVAESDSFDGIGLELLDGEIGAFDIDDCRDKSTGAINPKVKELIKRAGSYTEVTPSGTGLRIIGVYCGSAERGIKRPLPDAEGVSIEAYPASARYITVTGDHLDDTPEELSDITTVMDAVIAELSSPKGTGQPKSKKSDVATLPNHVASLLSVTGSGSYPSRSELLFAFLNAALRTGVADWVIIDACLDDAYSGCGIHDHCHKNGGEDYVKRQLERCANNTATATSGGKWQIKVLKGYRHQAWRETQKAMVAVGCQVFVRGGALVEPLWRWDEHEGRGVLTMKFVKYNAARLADQAANHAAEFYRHDARSNKWVRIDPPDDMIEVLLTRGDWDFAAARGIINTPTLRRDGTLLNTPGYDQVTGLWYKPPLNFVMPVIPDEPTKENAKDALALIKGLIGEFPFVDDMAKSVALAALITPVLRGAYTAAPMFFIDKPAAGTGGSYFVDLCSCLATGRTATPLKTSGDPRELAKELSAAAMEGSPILNLNNLTDDLESADLCQMVTEGVLEIRPFGKNDQLKKCDCRAMTIYANGNNIHVVGDLVRRTVTCRMDAKVELPELRTFKRKPVEQVLKDRATYLAAIFTVATAYRHAGYPEIEGAKAMAGFEEWSKWVQRPLMWLGEVDPFASQDELHAMDPEQNDRRIRIEALVAHAAELGEEFGAADVHHLATELDLTVIPSKYKRQDLYDAFLTTSRNIGKLSVMGIAKHLSKDLRNRVGDYHLELVSKDKKTSNTYQLWQGEKPFKPVM
jgi:hypothetical protein